MAFPFRTIPGLSGLYVSALSVMALAVTAGAPRNWAVSLPDADHTYGIRFRTGADAFFRPSIGWFIEHGYKVCLALLVVAILAEVLARAVRRTPHADTDTDGPTTLR